MTARSLSTGILAAVVTAGLAAAVAIAQEQGDESTRARDDAINPREIGLLERSERRLTQVDITVVGPPEVVTRLTPADFRIKVRLKKITSFLLDRHCPAPREALPPDPSIAALPETVAQPGRPVSSYMFYLDQPLLTMSGRANAISTARQLVRELVHDGHQAMILSNARELKVVEPMTSDAERLLEAIDRLEKDRDQWDTFANEEDRRVADVIETMNDMGDQVSGVERAMGRARRYQREETWRTEKSMRRLSMSLSRLSDLGSPKAVIYFADTMRSNAGEHYMAFFGERLRRTSVPLLGIDSESLMSQAPFDKIVNDATAQGIRFYPILSQGLVAPMNPVVPTAQAHNQAYSSPSQSNIRFRHARDTLANLGAETGGYAFVQGQAPARVAERIRDDFACLYIASFDPDDLPEDVALPVKVTTPRNDIEIRSRGRIVVQSESARVTQRLIAAFADPDDSGTASDPFAVRTQLIPTGFRNGRFTGLLQVSVPPGPLQEATWDLGATVIHADKVGAEPSGRLSVPQPGVPVVFEDELEFRPGDYEIVSVAHETLTGLVSSEKIEIRWPDLRKHKAAVSEVVILQPESGAFLRDDETRTSGSLARGPLEPIRADQPVALVGLVCRNRKQRGELSVDRRLIGETEVEFPPLEFALGNETCAQIRDLVPADTMGEGYYRYEIVVTEDDTTLYQGTRDFFAFTPSRHSTETR
jgi:VWFA-related protein